MVSFGEDHLTRLGCPPKAWWYEEAVLAVIDSRRARSEAFCSEAHRFAYVEVLRTSFITSRATVETWQATCNNLSPAKKDF